MQNKNLKIGDSGDKIKILQEKLKILGFYNAFITGVFGQSTEEGVKAFQEEYGLKKTGIVDEKMWQMLLELTSIATFATNRPTLQLGSKGPYVAELQTMLKALLYYTGNINSDFDTETENAVKRFQFHNKITTSGVVNSQSWNLLDLLFGNLNECALDNNITPNQPTIYTVIRGDTLYSIAKKFNTTVDAIKTLNQLTSNTLTIGQQLKIPSNENNPISPTIYTVVRGDTLYSIAKKFNTTVDAIKALNQLTSNTLTIGQQLKIPSNENTPVSPTIYTVVRGDTLYSIAQKFNTTVDAIKALNQLPSNILFIGQQLKIPSNENNPVSPTIYTVVRGDTLYSIAQKFNTTVDAIKTLNQLTNNILLIGQQLKIPSNENTPVSPTIYTVVRGDTLYSIAKKFNTTVDAIKALNQLPSNTLTIGQQLRIN